MDLSRDGLRIIYFAVNEIFPLIRTKKLYEARLFSESIRAFRNQLHSKNNLYSERPESGILSSFIVRTFALSALRETAPIFLESRE